MDFQISQRLKNIPPYLFAEIDEAKQKAIALGKDIIDLGVGDPDLPTPDFIIESMKEALTDSSTHGYPSGSGLQELRGSIAKWYRKRFKIVLDPDSEILPLVGSKEGIAHFPLAFVNSNDIVLVPDPCYPPYVGGSTLAGGKVYRMPLVEDNDFLPDLKKIPSEIINKTKLMFINYPNNPTGAVADKGFFKKVTDFAKQNDIIIVHDAAYTEIAFDGYTAPSLLEIEDAKDIGIEFHSLSKTFNMTGWRIGWVSGNKELVKGLVRVKSNIDSGVFEAIQKAAITALTSSPESDTHIKNIQEIYRQRQQLVIEGFRGSNLNVIPAKATFYLWCRIPEGRSSTEFSKYLLKEAEVVVTPGIGLGSSGEGYIRISLTSSEDELEKAVDRINKVI